MCGICGVHRWDGKAIDRHIVAKMNSTLQHRGPDGHGMHSASSTTLAMRRLSVIDIDGSEQPLYNEDESIAMVFNGELYNFRQNRITLQNRGHVFRTEGDGETIPHLYEEYGVDCVEHISGQFAFALLDENEQRLLLARDRMGQKPLYYYATDEVLIFASEIKAILCHPDVPRQPIFDDPAALALYLGYGYMPSPQTAFKDIYMLPPGHRLICRNGAMTIEPYWVNPPITDIKGDDSADVKEWQERVLEQLKQAVLERLIADVPLGSFLSGGLDSSLIVALMREQSNMTVKTFSIGFTGDASFDETPYAKQVAQTLETDHEAFMVSPQAMGLLPKLVWHYDQPFADSSAIPTYLVSQLTRQHVTVALTGDGGDELFAGYERFYATQLAQQLRFLPKGMWKLAAKTLDVLPEGSGYYDRVKRAGRFARAVGQPLAHAYFDWVRLFNAEWVKDLTQQPDRAGQHFQQLLPEQPQLNHILDANINSYLPDDLLIKADRCSMAASLEARAPFMAHELVELVAQMPINYKLRGNVTKYLLKKIGEQYLPSDIVHRKKHGFGVPLGTWLRQDDRAVRELLLGSNLGNRGLFDMVAVQRLLDEHQNHQRDHGQRIWTLLTLETWYQTFVDNPQGRIRD